jgi:coenzyme F420-reducing hydrogenase alpha subunit
VTAIKEIKLDYITKIYGHASLDVKIRGNRVKRARIDVFESSRFFESLVRGKKFDEIPSITSRICGICSASHNITSIMAVENAFGVEPSEQTKLLRELLVCGEFIESHALHSYFLALPDYLGAGSILDLAKKRPADVERALRLKRLGNQVHIAIGGRSIHPLTTKVGGFNQLPTKAEFRELLKSLEQGKKDAIATVRLFSSLKKIGFQRQRKLVALRNNDGYALLSGVVCLDNVCIPPNLLRRNLKVERRLTSTSKFVTWGGKEYNVGPLARIHMNHKFLSKDAKRCLKKAKLNFNSPIDGNMARTVELVHCIDRCMEIVKNFRPKEDNEFDFDKLNKKRRFEGFAITEAPRGILFHRYRINREGIVKRCEIITPTAQNLKCIETDVKQLIPKLLGNSHEKIISGIEELIRSYDPCISCSTHFLEVNWDDENGSKQKR